MREILNYGCHSLCARRGMGNVHQNYGNPFTNKNQFLLIINSDISLKGQHDLYHGKFYILALNPINNKIVLKSHFQF